MAANQIYPANGLQINFLGLPMVFNDGQTANTLVIALTNNNFSGSLQPAQDNNIVFTQKTPISVWFVVDVHQASSDAHQRNWALTSNDALHNAKVSLTAAPGNWDIQRSDNLSGNPLNDSLKGWRLTAQEDLTLLPGHSILLTLNGFTSAEPDGATSAYCQVEMPNLDAGREAKYLTKVIGPITKSRVMITGDRMGIGTGAPNSALEVNGGVAAKWITFNKLGEKYWGFGGQYTTADKIQAITLSVEDYVAFGIYPGTKGFTPHSIDITGDLNITNTQGSNGGNLVVDGNTTVKGQIRDGFGPLLPVGTIVAYGGKEPPPGWLLCNGQSLPWNEPDEGDMVDEYAELRRLVGDRVPDLRDRFVVGAGPKKLGSTGGEAEHVLTFDEMPTHRHGMWVASNQEANYGYVGDERIQQQWYAKVGDRKGPLADPYRSGGYQDDIRAKTITEAGGGKSHNNMPPYYALTYIIKY